MIIIHMDSSSYLADPYALYHLRAGDQATSYPQPPNLCTEAVIDCVMITCMLAH